MNVIKNLSLQFMHLPAYSHELAPVDKFFRFVKNKLRSSMIDKEYSLSKSDERKIIFECIKDTKQLSIYKMWIEFINTAMVRAIE